MVDIRALSRQNYEKILSTKQGHGFVSNKEWKEKTSDTSQMHAAASANPSHAYAH
jgi:hypothetical protein